MGKKDWRSRIIRPGEWTKAAKYLGQLVAVGDTEEQAIANCKAGQLSKFIQIDSSINFCYGTPTELTRYLIPPDRVGHELYLSKEEWRKLLDVLPQEVQGQIKEEVLGDDSE